LVLSKKTERLFAVARQLKAAASHLSNQQACSPRIAEVFNEFPQAALLFLRFVISFDLFSRHRLWLS
jgi:hypothetical protein